MHILPSTSATLESLIEPVDLAQEPGDMVALSFSDSDLGALAGAWKAGRGSYPSLRLAALRDLRHPMSVDLWIDRTAVHARAVLVRLLGGYDWWPYGCDRLSAIAREKGIALIMLPGECSERDERLAFLSTVPAEDYDAVLRCFREGGASAMAAALRHLSHLAGSGAVAGQSGEIVARAGFYAPGIGTVDQSHFAGGPAGAPRVPVVFYRSVLLAADTEPVDALCEALARRGIVAVPLFLTSMRDREAVAVIKAAVAAFEPPLIVTTTAFAVAADPAEASVLDQIGLPVIQAAIATTRREAWLAGQRGLVPADLAMHVVLPELDGRLMAGVLSFKETGADDPDLGIRLQINRAEADRVEQVARRIAAHIALQEKAVGDRKIVIVLPDYPAATGRAGYAVGLDVPQSAIEIMQDLRDAGYGVDGIPATARDLMRRLEMPREAIRVSDYVGLAGSLPVSAMYAVEAAWGGPAGDAAGPAFAFRHASFGNVIVAFAPDRGRSADRRVEYHDPASPPCHALVAFGLWMREILRCDAIVHLGAHGTLEWLPGKTVALSANCFPEIVAGAVPVIYPFIVSNPGEAAQAKRRLGAVTIGHLTPPLAGAGLTAEQEELERLVDEYAQADGLDRRRRDRLAGLIVSTAARTGLAAEAGVDRDTPDEALAKIDAWLCDLKDFAVKDGLHVYGRAAPGDTDQARIACAAAERRALADALEGRRLRPGPSGAPSRGRMDVLPTGRNIFVSDPRTMPTPTAVALGEKAAQEVVRTYLQRHGEYPRGVVMDLWGSASLRTGGEELAQGLALMGCRPQWDHASGRVVGVDVMPLARVGRPRIDVTWRISGLFRDMFPTQIALVDAAVGAIARRREEGDENPLATRAAGEGGRPRRIFGSAPGTYGAGVEELLTSGRWDDRGELGRAYLETASHAYGGPDGDGETNRDDFARRVAEADMLVHAGDDPGRDILEGSADVAFVGGFAAALGALGGSADLIMLDTTDPDRPAARSIVAAVTRVVRSRVLNRRFIEGQMRHGPRGASEFAETVDRLVGFAETTGAIPEILIEDVHEAYLGDRVVREFLLDQNPAAARAIAERFAAARRRGLWHPRRNAVDDDLAALIAEARGLEEAA